MPNKNYLKGYRFEKKTQKYLENIGYITYRQAKSSFPDIIAIKKGETVLVECKVNGKLSRKEKENAKEIYEITGIIFMLAYNENGKVKLKKLYG